MDLNYVKLHAFPILLVILGLMMHNAYCVFAIYMGYNEGQYTLSPFPVVILVFNLLIIFSLIHKLWNVIYLNDTQTSDNSSDFDYSSWWYIFLHVTGIYLSIFGYVTFVYGYKMTKFITQEFVITLPYLIILAIAIISLIGSIIIGIIISIKENVLSYLKDSFNVDEYIKMENIELENINYDFNNIKTYKESTTDLEELNNDIPTLIPTLPIYIF